MNEITNKHLFITMIVIGFITILVILSQNKSLPLNTTGYNLRNSLGASVYPAYDYSNYDYTNTGNYTKRSDYWYRSNSNTTSTTSTYSIPSTPTTSTTTTYYYEYPTTTASTYYDQYNNNGYSYQPQGYVPVGCENGTDYSTVTNQPCG